jgi:Protein of unknown function (DUF1614)/Polyphosphate kinase 2 (PPK2)
MPFPTLWVFGRPRGANCAYRDLRSGKWSPSNGGREEKPKVHYLPLPVPLFALLVGAFLVVFALIQIGILRYAYLRIGVSPRAAMALLLGSLIGSYINIPILELPKRVVPSSVETSHDYRHHRIRHNRHRIRTDAMASTVIAVNVGGAVIPALLSLYLLFKNRMWWTGVVATAVIARLDRPSGNITGFAITETTLGGKWLELLSEIAPGLRRAAIMFNPDIGAASVYMPSLSPWHIVRSDDKRRARLNCIAHILSLIPHKKAPRAKVKLPIHSHYRDHSHARLSCARHGVGESVSRPYSAHAEGLSVSLLRAW